MSTGFKKATVAAASVPATQTNFPAYVDLSRLGITTLAEAQSVRCYADESKVTELAREIVSVTEMHVKIPSLTSTFVLYVEYDGVSSDYAVTDTYGRNAVWSDYAFVWHMISSSGAETDVTGNGVSGTYFGNLPDPVAGKLGNGQDFDGTGDYMSRANTIPYSDFSMSFWINVDTWYSTNRAPFVTQRQSDPIIQVFYEGALYFRLRQTNAGGLNQINAGTMSLNTDYLITATIDISSGEMDIYKNTTNYTTTYTKGDFSSAGNFEVGREPLNVGYFDYLDGDISEFRVRYDVVSADWVSTEYNNQSDESTFWGTWSDAGGAPTYRFNPQIRPFAGL